MKRDDETLLEYLIRIAKEKGEGLGEELQQLGVDRLREARPDAARRQGLMPDQLDIVQDDYMTQGVQDSLPPSQTMPQMTDTAGVDRAAIEQMITQAGGGRPFEEPQPLQEWTGRGAAPEPDPALLQRMLTQPGQTDIAREQWTGAGPLPGETKSLIDLDQSMTGMREQPAQQDLPSPLTSRMPTADIAPRDASLSPDMLAAKEHYEKLQGAKVDVPDATEPSLLKQAEGVLQQASEESLKSPTSIEDYLKKVVGYSGKSYDSEGKFQGWGRVQPGHLMTSGFGGELGKWFYKLLGKPDIRDVTTKGIDLAPVIVEAKEKITGEKEPEDTGWIKDLLVEDGGEVPDVKKDSVRKKPTVAESIAQAKVFTGSKKRATTKPDQPTYFGHNSKEEFLRAAGILGGDKKSKDFTERMDKIDSDSRMFDMIAMLGGAGNSRVGTNFRNKSYQRLRLESDMDQREWDRQFKIMAHPWDTWYWHDPEAGIKPESRPRGMGMGPGWQQQPTARDKGTPHTRNYNEILEMWDGTPKSEALMRIRFINEMIPSGMFLDADGQDGLFNNFMDVAFPLPNGGKRWTPLEIQQAKLAISKGSKGDIEKILKRKGYVPPELRSAIKELFPELFPE